MFTGIIEELGTVTERADLAEAARLTVSGPMVAVGAAAGESIAVNGVCLTVVESDGQRLTFDVMRETLDRSSLGALLTGDRVNLERPVTPGGRLGGHLVQGHVDGVGVLIAREAAQHWQVVRTSLPTDLGRYVVAKGSVSVDGISLTVVDVTDESFSVGLIPTTLALTTLGHKQIGEPVNIEVDIIAKYVEKMLSARG